MSATSSGSDCCINCGHALPTPGAKFCVECGHSQRRTKKCVQCTKEMTNYTDTFCVHCGHDQRKPLAPPETKPCIKCGNELPSSTPFCGACGQNQSQPLQQQQSATSTPQLSTTVTTLGEDVNKSKDATMGPVDNNSSMEVDTSKGDATPPSLDPSEPCDDPSVDHSSTPDISSSTSSVDKDVTEEQGLNIDDQSPVGSKRLSDDESSSEHSKRSKTDKEPDHEAIVAPPHHNSKRQLSNGVPQTDQVKRSKTEEDLSASGKEKDNEKPGASKDSPVADNSGANELEKNSSGSTVDSDSITSKTNINNNVVDPASSSGAVIKEKVTDCDSGINISDSVGHAPSGNNGNDGDNHSEKKDGANQLKPLDTHIDPLTIPSDAPSDDKRVQQNNKSSPATVPKVTEHTIEDKKKFENGKATNDLDTNEPPGDLLKNKDDKHTTPAGSTSLCSDEDDTNFIGAAEEESHGSTSTGVTPEQV